MFIILIPMLLCVTLFTLMKAILYFPSLSVTKKKFLFFQIIFFIMIIIVLFYLLKTITIISILFVYFNPCYDNWINSSRCYFIR